jgi:hypothetical protein
MLALALFYRLEPVRRAGAATLDGDSTAPVWGREMEDMANMDVSAWRGSEIPARSPASTALEFGDDDVDFPPTAHPVRELITATIAVVSVIALIIWCGSKLL